MEKDDFIWLQKWYHNHCNGDWEHDKRICIKTIDNPGWSISINLLDTDLENKVFKKINLSRNEHDWVFSEIRDHSFEGRGGPMNLIEILNIFRKWSENEI